MNDEYRTGGLSCPLSRACALKGAPPTGGSSLRYLLFDMLRFGGSNGMIME